MRIDVGKYKYSVVLWAPGMEVFTTAKAVAIDTETQVRIDERFPLKSEKSKPKVIAGDPVLPVVMQVCSQEDRTVHVVWWTYMEEYLNTLMDKNSDCIFVFHNAPFDLRVMGMDDEPMRTKLVAKVNNRQVVDTGLRFNMGCIATGVDFKKIDPALDDLTNKLLNYEIEKNPAIRLTFKQDMDLTEEFLIYAAKDAAATAQVYEALNVSYPTEDLMIMGYIALSDIAFRGILVDPVYQAAVAEEFQAGIEKSDATLGLYGFYAGVKGNTSIILQNLLQHFATSANIDLPLVPKSQDIVDRIKKLSEQEPLSEMEQEELDKAKREKLEIGMSKKVIKALTELPSEKLANCTGNLPLSFFQAHNARDHQNKMLKNYLSPLHTSVADGRVHPRFSAIVKTGRTSCRAPNIQNVPRDEGLRGCYAAPAGWLLFACDYAQLELCALADTCYTTFGYSVMMDVINSGEDVHKWFGGKIKEMDSRSAEAKEATDYRQMAKAANFGFPGGLGAVTFQLWAKSTYGVDLTIDECKALKALWIKAFPEMDTHLQPHPDTRRSTDGNQLYTARTLTGRIRTGATYCSACNYPFQGLAADGARLALWYLYLERFRVVNFIHDETLTELKEDEYLQRNIGRIQDLMVLGMRQVIKNVNIKVEGSLMRRWHKSAEPVYDDNNNLIVWSEEAGSVA